MRSSDCYIGLMSGTSVDAVDALVAQFDDASDRPTIHAVHSHAPPAALRARLLSLSEPSQRLSLVEFGQLDQAIGEWFGEAARLAIDKAGLDAAHIRAIGSHGQTVWHAPDDRYAFSLQIGAASRIAAMTGCDVVSDFRNADIALGGQGAPLVCACHGALFGTSNQNRAVINIGGIANITILPAGADRTPETITGFDTGPGNGLMDAWIARHRGQDYDADGEWARGGRVDAALLEHLQTDPYFARMPPKSTGREYFGLDWLDRYLNKYEGRALDSADVQATLCELTAATIADAVKRFAPGVEHIYLCGGGIRNQYLFDRISALVAPCPVAGTDELGIDPAWIEALAFAWLARQRVLGRPGNAPGVTGACHATVLGGLHSAPRRAIKPR